MKRAILLLVVVVGGAFYLGWFTFTTDNSGESEHVNIVIDKNKIRQDEAKAVQRLHAYEQQVQAQGQAGQASGPAPENDSASPYETTQSGGNSTYSAQPSAAGGDPYELPQPPQPPQRQATETSDSFSRGFQ
ncbi:MAG TPA: hypothetical protein VF278_19035 [Pirellulales bacterium]